MRTDRAFWFALLTGALVVALAAAFAFRNDEHVSVVGDSHVAAVEMVADRS